MTILRTSMDQAPSPLEDHHIATILANAMTPFPGVDVYTGPGGRFATYGPGHRIQGIQIDRHNGQLDVAIEVVAAIPRSDSLPKLAGKIRRRIRQTLHALHGESIGKIDVRISDIDIQP